ncbi:hypothetical protein BHE74_00008639 [Ensete ventricosum]|nr:hypothetical protein BHE74_00008639 [Ensete ventricosum]
MSIVMLRHFVSVLLSSRWSNAVYPATYADPYLNTDAGTMSPFEHGEVFVLDDGGEVKIAVDVIVWSPEALLHASVACRRKLVVDWVPSSDLEETAAEEVRHGILVPGGFGDRGVQGKILAAKYARENKIPYLGICLGMQIAVIEFARSVMNLREANSTEFDPDTTAPVVIFMPEKDLSGFFRYGKVSFVDERHRHRYEIIELPSHPYYVGVQFHPEFKSRPGKPSAVFLAASSRQLDAWLQASGGQLSPPVQQHAHSNGYSRIYRNGSLKKPAVNSLVNGGSFHSNGNNGVHVVKHST